MVSIKLPKVSIKLAVPLEAQRLVATFYRHLGLTLPWQLLRSASRDPRVDGVLDEARFLEIIGDTLLKIFNDLGPMYGKGAQVALSRLSPELQQVANGLQLTRLYGDWPALPFDEVEDIFDREIPKWRQEFRVDAKPLGVASIAQAHAAMDSAGNEWVIKFIKPKARKRLLESLAAIQQVLGIAKPMAVTRVSKRAIRELEEMCASFHREIDLSLEATNIERARARLEGVEQPLKIPKVFHEYSSKKVLTIERFHGIPLSRIVAGKAELSSSQRSKLAKTMLKELLIQVFEVGLFHADPHAGNLILLNDGTVGLFDWGLTGELLESDRKHIAAMLKAIIAVDMDRLVAALMEMASDAGQKKVSEAKIKKELQRLVRMVEQGKEDPARKPSMQDLMEQALRAADKLGIPIPSGLLLMAKSLLTIEGLARGIDPSISLARVAMPVLFRAAKPTLKDFWQLSQKAPKILREVWFPKK